MNWLLMAEFAYNNSKYSSTGVTPFFAAYGRDPKWGKDFEQQMKQEVPAARARTEEVTKMCKLLETK